MFTIIYSVLQIFFFSSSNNINKNNNNNNKIEDDQKVKNTGEGREVLRKRLEENKKRTRINEGNRKEEV
jgi:hypothetical protein